MDALTDLPANARPTIRQAPQSWHRFLAVCAALENPDVELTAEEVAPFFALFAQLRRLRVPFDPAFTARVDELRRHANTTDDFFEDDTDSDDDDDRPESGWGA